mgnify:CR=1 FL=1
MNFVFPPQPSASLPVVASDQRFPIHRVYCVGRNYADHAQEMGDTGREPPFFFTKPADAVISAPAGQSVPPFEILVVPPVEPIDKLFQPYSD